MKILLLSPPLFDFYSTPGRSEPLGLLYIKKSLREMEIPGVRVEVYDAAGTGRKKRVMRPAVFAHTDAFYGEDESFFSLLRGYHRYGDSFDKIAARAVEGEFDLIGISAMFSGYYPDVEELVVRLKRETGALVVLGGWAVEAEGGALFPSSRADFFLRGSGEAAFPSLVRSLMGHVPMREVPGLMYRSPEGGIRSNPPLHVPVPPGIPERESVYYFQKKRIAKMILSRGCPFRCRFCAVGNSGPFSLRSLSSIEAELEYLAGLGVGIVDFEDDNIFCSEEFSCGFIPLLKRFHERGLGYAAMNGMTAANILPRVEELIDAGFIEFNLSLVAGSGDLVSEYRRPFGMRTVQDVVTQINGRVKTVVFLIAGLPGSTPGAVLSDILELARLPVMIGISPLYMVPGVQLFDELGLPSDRRLMRGSALYRFGESFSREQVASLWKLVRMINRAKSQEGPRSEEYGENLRYFKKSLREGTWYRKGKTGSWTQGTRVLLDIPPSIAVCMTDGGMTEV